RKLSRKTALSLGMTLAASMAVSATVKAAAPIVVTQVEHGAAGFANAGNTTTITAANQTIIDYSKFDIPTGDTVRFIQPGSTATVLNRISGASPTAIDGNLFANGIVYMVNPAGVMFGQGAVINVGQIFAAAGNLSNSDFLQGINHFTDVTGSVLNAGNIHASAVNFVGQMVANSGEIIAPEGTVVMAAGNDVLIGKMDGNMFVKVSDSSTAATPNAHAAISNTGTVDAQNGQVNMSAGDMFSLAIRNTGSVTAGNITIHGGSHSTVLVSGKLDASNQGANGTGGTIKINGGNIGVGVDRKADGTYAAEKATLSATGANGGGNILIGVKADASSATGYSDASNYDYIGADALLNVSAAGSGAGGLVDTSGATLTVSPTATILAAGAGGGAAGQWLLDPVDIQITGATSGNIGTVTAAGTTEFSPTAATPTPATVAASAITLALTAGDNVTVSVTPQSGPDIGTDKGDITLMPGVSINPIIPAGSRVLLKLSATNNIDIEGTIASTGPGIMNVELDTAGNIYIGGAGTTPGAGSVSTFSSSSVGGNISLNTDGGYIYLASQAKSGWAINSTGSLGGGSVSLNAGGTIKIVPGLAGTPAAPGPGGIATGGGSLLLEARGPSTGTAISIGAVTLSSAGYAPGTGGGGMGIVCIGTGNILLSGTTLNANGARGANNGAYGGGGSIGIVTEFPDGGYGGQITFANVTFNSEGNGGGNIRVWPGGAEAGYLYQPINLQSPEPNSWSNPGLPYPYGDGFLIFQGANSINTAQLGPVVTGSGAGGEVTLAITPPTTTSRIKVTWTIAGGTGGAGSYAAGVTTPALSGGGLTVELNPAIAFTEYPSGGTGSPAGGGAVSGVAGLSTFNAFNTYFETYGTGANIVQPSVVSDGGGQDYENAEQPPGAQAVSPYASVPYIVGNIIIGGLQGTAPAATAVIADTGTASTGSIILDAQVDAIAPNLDNLITTTAEGSISYNYGLGQNMPLQTWIAVAGTALPTPDFIASGNEVMGSLNEAQFSTTGGNALGQVQLGNGPGIGVNNPLFDIPYIGGVFLGTTSSNMYLQGTIVDANGVTYYSPPLHTGAVVLNSTLGNIDLEAYAYGPFYTSPHWTGQPLSLTAGAGGTVNGKPNNAITIDGGNLNIANNTSSTTVTIDGSAFTVPGSTAMVSGTLGGIVPVEAIWAIGAYTNVPGLPFTAIPPEGIWAGIYTFNGTTYVGNAGFQATAPNGGNIFINGPSPATTSALFPVGNGLISNGGYTILGSEVSVLTTNSVGNAGNIHDGQSVFLSAGGDASVASVGTAGNAGNLTFDQGAKLKGFNVAVTSLCLDANSGYTSGNIVFNISNPTQTSTEGFISSGGQVAIVAGNYVGSAGNISIGGYFGITSGAASSTMLIPLIIESVASPTDDVTTNALATTLGIVNSASGQTFIAPPAGTLSNLTGNAGFVSIGAYASLKSGGSATAQAGAISIGSYSSIGNAGYVTTGLSDAQQQHIIASSGGLVTIFSAAELNSTYTSATSAMPGNITVNGTISTTSAGAAGDILIQTVATPALQSSPATPIDVTIGGSGLLNASSQTSTGGTVSLFAPYGVVTIDLSNPAQLYAVNVSGTDLPGVGGVSAAGSVNIYGQTGVHIIAGGIAAMGGINNGHGGGGGVSIASGGYIIAHDANINASSAYGGGGGVAIFSTASGINGPVDLGSGSIINTSGGGYGGGGAVLIAGSGNVSISGATITANGNGGGAISINSGAGKIIFEASNTFSSLQSQNLSTTLGGGGGYTVNLTASVPNQTLNAGGGGGATGGYAGGGVALTGVPTFSNGLFNSGITAFVGRGSAAGIGATSSGGTGTGTGGTVGGGNAGLAGALSFIGNEIDFGTTSSTGPVSVTTDGNGQIYNDYIVLYEPTTLTESGAGNIVFNNISTPTTISTAPGVTAGLTVSDNSGNIIFGNNFTFSTGSTALSSLLVTDTSGQIQLDTGGGNFVSTTSGAQTFSGNTFVEETGSTGSFVINAGGEITLTGSLSAVASG
ncbi:MAG: two-partner secretion domain-containing protein, partial [Phycisphaerae bacterium]